MRPAARLLPDGRRLHLQHGPIDLIIGVDGNFKARNEGFKAAKERFETVLDELVTELPLLRSPVSQESDLPIGGIAKRMDAATRPHSPGFITPMAAVAGSVADTILEAMVAEASFTRAYVNNGGDIALHLGPNQNFTTSVSMHDGTQVARIVVKNCSGIGGIATSGRHGRSFSFGIADSVTVLAANAAIADATATLIANAVDLPKNPAITRVPASELDPDTDLGKRPVVTDCKPLSRSEITRALNNGIRFAEDLKSKGYVISAALCLGGEIRVLGEQIEQMERSLTHA